MARAFDQQPVTLAIQPTRLPSMPVKGRGATLNMASRFETSHRETVVDDIDLADDIERARLDHRPKTIVHVEYAKSIISRNDSPDIRFDQSLNPYRGCEHGCIYCYARPSHGYVNLSPGVDFETQLFAKRNAAELLRKEISKKGYVPSAINFGANTDPYQPIERDEKITRACLEVLLEARHPITIVTKNALIERDIDLLQQFAAQKLVQVFVSISQLDNELTRILEPRASAPARRLHAVRALSQAGVPTSVLVAPIIPFVNDEFIERVLDAAKTHGACAASYTIIRLPYEVKTLFKDWLATHFPDRAEHVMSRIRDIKRGRENVSEFGERMRGTGIYAELIRQRFRKACTRLGLNSGTLIDLDVSAFRAVSRESDAPHATRNLSPQIDLF